ncbi:protein-tyrosine phosphatase [Suhomyces tanzawaensis NRRL Y-17324]|uniref:Protein-tyrosine phosphatase n=1 Tax=Suhomyces tanzawaensis NRRL Y-17324 TaxID=984487 RepID=A0A1E4SDK6_9ASCO|nr:protein-tyrosine phosphatase [Suhomyces tanzawaensis NRRL Y-17324]ODV77472.1 protein-tyrosine phosphatase [Suhomyces tanzawaensis NRRL Y-17324]
MELEIPGPLTPPLRFNTVQKDLYRGAYPREINFAFLKTLQLKTIISLTPDPITLSTDPVLFEFARVNAIDLIHLECSQSGKGKKRGVPMGYSTILNVLDYIIHNKYAPVYIHCLNGGQVTSLVIACLRKLQFWSSISIFNEFINFTTNITVNDRSFVEGFKGEISIHSEDKVEWLWVGMSKGVIGAHPRIKVSEKAAETGE